MNPDLPTMIPEPPIALNPCQQRAWNALTHLLRRRAAINHTDGEQLVAIVAGYCWYRAARDRLLADGDPQDGRLKELADTLRLHTRQFAWMFGLLQRDQIENAPLDANGEDTDLAEWFDES